MSMMTMCFRQSVELSVVSIHLLLLLASCTALDIYTKKNLARYDDPSIKRFPSQSSKQQMKDVRLIVLSNDTVYIGAVNTLAAVSFDLRSSNKVVKVEPTPEDLEKCDSKDDCRNNMTELLLTDDGNIQACGTSAGSSKCWSFNSALEEKKYLANIPSTCIPLERGMTMLKFNDTTFIASNKICKIFGGNFLRSSPDQLNEPNFVSSYELDNSGYVYFLLTEISSLQNRKYMFSRIARVCKYEKGFSLVSNKLFLTFLKAQLDCKKNGDRMPVYYDELQASVKLTVDGEDYIYGVFSTSSEVGAPSAVCRYRVKDVMKTFLVSQLTDITDSNVKEKTLSNIRQQFARDNCKPNLEEGINEQELLSEVSTFRKETLLFDSVKPYDEEALLTTDSRLTSIAIDVVKGRSSKLMLFLGGMDGLVYKVSFETETKRSHVVEHIQPFKSPTPIYDLKLNKGIVYAGGSPGLASFPVHRCGSYMMCDDCNAVNDPYCVWNKTCMEGLAAVVEKCPPAPNDFACKIEPINRAALRCVFISESASAPTVLTWTHDKKEIASGDLYVISKNDKQSLLVVKDLTSSTTGTYECVVGNELHRSSCNYTLAPTTTTTTVTTVTHNSSHVNFTRPDKDISTTAAAPAVPATNNKRKTYLVEFQVSLAFLMVVLIVLLIVLIYILFKKRVGRGNIVKQPKQNGLSPNKKKMYKVNGKDEALLHATDGGGGGETEKSSPTIKQPKVTVTGNGTEDVELGEAKS